MAAVREAVLRRDGGCVATQPRIFGKDIAQDACRNSFGNPIPYDSLHLLEVDRVKTDSRGGKAVPYSEAHAVAVCPHHHRLSQRWRSDSHVHREAERAWLAKHYPEEWA
jgi:hypothetical protein